MRSDRLLSLLLLLQTHGRITAPEVARRLEVSVRTVYRDVAALSTSGVPVYTEQGRHGGLVLLPGYRTDVTGLTAAESRALVALTGRAVPEDLGLGSALATAVHKLVAAVPPSHREAAERARRRVLVDHQGWHRPTSPAPHLETVQQAVWEDRRLRLRYRHADARPAAPATAYLLDPWGLVVKAGVWYLVAAHRARPRLFRVDRVAAASLTEHPSRRPADLDLEAVWRGLRDAVERPRDAVSVRLRARADVLPMILRVTVGQRVGPAEPRLPPEPAAAGPRGERQVEVTLDFRSPGAAVGSLLGFGEAVEVLQPPDVRDRMARTARAALAVYDPAVAG